MDDLTNSLEQWMKDPEFKEEWDKREPEYEIKKQIIEARIASGMTQEQLAEACGIKQSNLSRLENGESNPTLSTLQLLAHGMGKKLKLTFL